LQRTFSIITASKGRLEHLKLSLPGMLKQPNAEVIVVDYSCPEGTGNYVREHFPAARVTSVEGEEYFSNWKARNAGAAIATSDLLVFCDSDIILSGDAVAWIAANLPENAYGCFGGANAGQFNKRGSRLAHNQVKGFQVVPTAPFRSLGGYDEVLEGYAAGGDTDLGSRLHWIGVEMCELPPHIIDSVVEHDDSERLAHHRDSLAVSYCAGMLYRSARLHIHQLTRQVDMPLERRRELYAGARQAAGKLGSPDETVGMVINIADAPVLMPRQLGYEKGTQKASLRIEVSVENKIEDGS
jgi:glycosyltransferase involved in cell wall biosynthesis